jgi:hypothetical protein
LFSFLFQDVVWGLNSLFTVSMLIKNPMFFLTLLVACLTITLRITNKTSSEHTYPHSCCSFMIRSRAVTRVPRRLGDVVGGKGQKSSTSALC